MELITTICGMSMSDIQQSIIRVCYKHAVEAWYGSDELSALDLGSIRHLRRADSAWHTDRMLAGGAWVH